MNKTVDDDDRYRQLREANEKLVLVTLQLQDADRRRDDFLRMLAHELRNPLAPISAGAVLLERMQVDNPQVGEIAGVIQRQVNHLRRIVDDLLDVSRYSLGKNVLEIGAVSVRELVSEAGEMLADRLECHPFTIEFAAGTQDLVVPGDKVRLLQAVTNLLDNACKFSQPSAFIGLQVAIDGAMLTLSVNDGGIGIESGFLPQVFDLFSQHDPGLARSKGGLGVGLALAHEIAELHGGSLTASSGGAGTGARFVLAIPAQSQAAPS